MVWSKNVLLIALVFIIPMSALRAIEAQKVWKLGFDAEKETAIDITHRFEANDAFDIQKKYKLLAIGAPEGMRKYYHHTPYSDDNLLNRSYTAWWQWGQRQVFSFYEPRLKWKDVICVITGYPASSPYEKVKKTILELNKDLLRQAKPYPHSKSVYVDGEYIVVVYDQVNLDYIRSILKDGK